MVYFYEPGSVRWKRFNGTGDLRGYRAPKGWKAFAELLDYHPITGKHFTKGQWWIREECTGV